MNLGYQQHKWKAGDKAVLEADNGITLLVTILSDCKNDGWHDVYQVEDPSTGHQAFAYATCLVQVS